jgi:cyclophilin family peptidyl-prolyl cis-trans isomerase/protein-disulfide isomerase
MHRLLLILLLSSSVLISCGNKNTAAAVDSTAVPTQAPVIVTRPPRPTASPENKLAGGIADHALGPESAFLTIVYYSDFQCQLCVDVARSLETIQFRYPNDVRIVWRHFPQPENDKALLAAQASEAASAQGKFWEMHDQILAHQADWRSLPIEQFRAKLSEYAKTVGLADLAAFETALNQQTYGDLVNKALQEAIALDLKGVPALLFKGQPYSGRVDEYGLDAYARLRLLEKRWYPHQPDLTIDQKKHYTATLVTEKGNIVIELYTQAAPVTVNNFVFLARDGWYDENTFHLVVPDQIAQTGDPSGSGFGTAGYNIVDEHDNGLSFDREGVVAMASQRGVENSGSSQFFITYGPLRPAVDYDKQFTIFGQVTQGMDILRQLTPRNPFDQLRFPNPLPGDKLMRVEISESS